MPLNPPEILKEKRAIFILWALFFLYVLWFSLWCTLKFYSFSYDDFDLAIHDQIIWNILHGRIFNSILGIDFLGNHAHFISFLVAPLYSLIPTPLFLLFLQTLSLAAGVFPLYALGRLHLDRRMSLTVCAVYLLYPGLGFTNLYEFHPTCFATFFLLCTAYYFHNEKFLLFNVFMILSLSCQENIPLIFFMWGIYSIFLKREWKWVWWPTCAGFFYFLFCVYVVLPGFNKNTFNFFSIYGPLGSSLTDVAKNCLLHPLQVLTIILAPHKIHYIVQLFVSAIFIPLLSPLSLLPALLIFVQHLLSVRLSEVSLHYHYTAELIPFIFMAFIFGIKKIFTFQAGKFRNLSIIFLVYAAFINFLIGPHFYLGDAIKQISKDKEEIKAKWNLVNRIPPEEPVVSTFEFMPHLSHRQELYSFHHVYWGFYTLSHNPYKLPSSCQYALINFDDSLTFQSFYGFNEYKNLQNFFGDGGWKILDIKGSTILFQKSLAREKLDLFSMSSIKNSPQVLKSLNIGDIEYEGYDLKRIAKDSIDFIFYWKCNLNPQRDIHVYLDLVDLQGNLIKRWTRPIAYGILPTQAWGAGEYIKERVNILIPRTISKPGYKILMGLYDFETNFAVKDKTNKPIKTELLTL